MVGKKRQERLWRHLLETEELIGSPLRVTPRSSPGDCPIRNFAPDRDRQGRLLDDAGFLVWYGRGKAAESYRCSYLPVDTVWWNHLRPATREQVTMWVVRKLRARHEVS